MQIAQLKTELAARWKTISSLRALIRGTVYGVRRNSEEVRAMYSGVFEFFRGNDIVTCREETTVKMGSDEAKPERSLRLLQVFDGKLHYVETNIGGRLFVFRLGQPASLLQRLPMPDGRLLRAIEAAGHARVRPETKRGHQVWVVDLKLRDPSSSLSLPSGPELPDREVWTFSRESGIVMQVSGLSSAGRSIFTFDYEILDTGTEALLEPHTYVPSEGATIRDIS